VAFAKRCKLVCHDGCAVLPGSCHLLRVCQSALHPGHEGQVVSPQSVLAGQGPTATILSSPYDTCQEVWAMHCNINSLCQWHMLVCDGVLLASRVGTAQRSLSVQGIKVAEHISHKHACQLLTEIT
jgi:hypothetical protein